MVLGDRARRSSTPLFDAFDFAPGNEPAADRRRCSLAVMVLFVAARPVQVQRRPERARDPAAGRGARRRTVRLGPGAPPLPTGRRLVVVLPAYNEAENVGRGDRAHARGRSRAIRVIPIVVSDGSDDGPTAEVAREAGAIVAGAADPPRRRPGAAGRLRDRAAAGRRDRRDARRRRAAPARGDRRRGRRRSSTARPTT